MGLGVVFSWTSPALPHLTSPASSFPVTEIQGSWIASLLGWGTISGYIINPVLITRLGSKRTLLILAAPQILSWTIIYLGRNWLLLGFARVIAGFGYGAGQCSTAIYLSEISDEQNRGILLTLVKLSINIGIFITMIFGAFLSYDTMNLVLMIMPIVFVLAFYSMPDTKGIGVDDFDDDDDDDDVEKKLTKNSFDDVVGEKIVNGSIENPNDFVIVTDVIRNADSLKEHPNDLVDNSNSVDHHPEGFTESVDYLKQHPNDLSNKFNSFNHHPDNLRENPVECAINENLKKEHIEQALQLPQTSSSCPSVRKSSKNVWWMLFMLKNNRNALLIIIVVTLTDTFSGHVAIFTYTQQIFEYSGASLKPEYAALILAVLKVGASLISTLVVEKFGRRDLFLSTGILAGLSQGSVALFFFLKLYLEIDISSITWLPLFGVSMYEIIGSVGISSLFYVYQGELFSEDVKGLGVTFTNGSYEFISFFIKLYFQFVIDAIGIYSVFFGFGICCVAGSCIVYWISPETKGKSREEIKMLLS